MKRNRVVSSLLATVVGSAALLTASCASTPQKKAGAEVAPPATAAPTASPAEAKPAAGTPAAPPDAAAEAAMAGPAPRQPIEPPDGQWLVDLDGREYFVTPLPKHEGFYLRIGPNQIRVPPGVPLFVEREDESTFYVKIFRNVEGTGPTPGLRSLDKTTPEQLEAIAKEYEVSTQQSDALSFAPIGQGLPTRGQWRNGFALADVDGDGAVDLVHGPARRSMGGSPAIFRGDGAGNFKRWDEAKFPPYPYDYGDAAAGDFNDDGKIDLAFAIHLRGLVAMLGDGKGNFTPFSDGLDLSNPDITTWSANPFTSRAIETIDWNRDGRDDILALSEGPARSGDNKASAYAPGKRVYLAGPKGWTIAKGASVADPTFGDGIALGDLNADGRTDFITATSVAGSNAILNTAGADTSWEVSTLDSIRPSAFVFGVALAELNGDRRGDVILAWVNTQKGVDRTGVDLFLTQPGGKSRVGLWGRTGNDTIRALATGDLDGDGNRDIVGFTDDAKAMIFKGQGKGRFTLETADGIDMKAERCPSYAVRLADLDRDGKDEIVASFAGEKCEGGGSIRAWKAHPSKRQ